MKFKFHPEALEDYKQAVDYYAQRGKPLARRFVEAVQDAIIRVTQAPQRWRVVEDDVTAASRADFRTVFSTQSKKILSLYLQ